MLEIIIFAFWNVECLFARQSMEDLNKEKMYKFIMRSWDYHDFLWNIDAIEDRNTKIKYELFVNRKLELGDIPKWIKKLDWIVDISIESNIQIQILNKRFTLPNHQPEISLTKVIIFLICRIALSDYSVVLSSVFSYEICFTGDLRLNQSMRLLSFGKHWNTT